MEKWKRLVTYVKNFWSEFVQLSQWDISSEIFLFFTAFLRQVFVNVHFLYIEHSGLGKGIWRGLGLDSGRISKKLTSFNNESS